jgi:hypothetical protein
MDHDTIGFIIIGIVAFFIFKIIFSDICDDGFY